MRQLFDLIGTHSNVNSIMPVIALISIAVVLVIYVLVKPKMFKYLVTVIIIVVGTVLMITGYKNMLHEAGLDLIITASKVLLFGLVGLLFSFILDILDSLFRMFSKKGENNKKIKSKRSNNTNKTQNIKLKSNEVKNTVNKETQKIRK